ncbi:hypothetical protein [Haladaptatus sp. NG-SE-30]
MVCPYLEYSDEGTETTFDEPRAFCTVIDEFVQPMRADICNDRYDLNHDRHCEIYRDHDTTKDHTTANDRAAPNVEDDDG